MHGPTFRLLGVPIRVEIWFLVTTLFFGLYRIEGRSNPVFWLVEWFVISAVSILVHEFGHAFAFRHYGQKPAIVLWGMGGLTYGEDLLPPRKSIVVSLAGPVAGILILGVPAFIARDTIGGAPYSTLWLILADIAFLNIAWGLVNLLPILPLDGGNICDAVLEIKYGEPRRQTARMISMVASVLFAIYAIVTWGEVLSFPVIFAVFLFVNNLVTYLRVRNGTDLFGGFKMAMPSRPADGEGRGADNVVSMNKARKKRDKRSPAELIKSGYDALEHRDYKAALRTTDRLRAKRLNGELSHWTNELAAWAHLGERNTLKAEEEIAQLPKNTPPSTPLGAVLALAQKKTDVGVSLMVKAMVDEPEGGPRLIGIDLFAEYGMIHRLARELVDLEGGSGFEAAVSLEGSLHRLNRTQDASTVSDVIMMG